MYTIFFTINCVVQLTFSKTFVDHLQFEQLIFFCLKVKLLKVHVRQMIFDCRPVFTFLSFAWMVSSSWKIVSTIEQTNFEQLIMSHFFAGHYQKSPQNFFCSEIIKIQRAPICKKNIKFVTNRKKLINIIFYVLKMDSLQKNTNFSAIVCSKLGYEKFPAFFGLSNLTNFLKCFFA